MDFTLKEWNKAYIADIAKYANNEKIASKLRDVFPFPYTYEDAVWYVNDCISKEGNGQLTRVIVVDGEAVGSIGIFIKEDVSQKCGELGYWLAEEFWRQGLMSRAVEQLCRAAFERFDIVRIFAEPFAHNAGSRGVLEKAGFVLEGVMKDSIYKWGNIYDSCMYALYKRMDLRERELEDELKQLLERIQKPDETAFEQANYRWSKVAKPLYSLGILEEDIAQIAGITGDSDVTLNKRALIIMCADNGVVAEGVTQTGQEVTAVVTANITRGDSCACLMAKRADVDVFPVDIGVACDMVELGQAHPLLERKIRRGTADFIKEPAMTRRETLEAVLTGISIVGELKEQGYDIIATGEMGIGNTTTSSAVASVLMGIAPELVTGRGAGLGDAGLKQKIRIVKQGIAVRRPEPGDGIDVLSKVGGLDLAGLAGVFLGGAIYRIPIVIDGFISATAAAAAAAVCGLSKEYMIAAHVSAEPAGCLLLEYLGKKPAIQAGMCLGEGTGAVAFLPLLDMALDIYRKMRTFSEIEIEDYKVF